MELRQLIYFVEVAKQEHVTEAANQLHVAQSAVSRQVALLEAELGVNLFTREGRRIQLTPIGRLFLDSIERAIGEIHQAKEKIEDYLNPEKGVIRLGLATNLSINTMPIALSQFRAEHPDIHFQLHQGSPGYLIEEVSKGRLNIAYTAPVPRNHDDVKGEVFYRERLMAIVPSNHPLAESPWIRLSQLREDRFVSFRSDLPLYEIIQKAFKQSGMAPVIAFEGEDIETIKSLVSAGFGVALLPEHALLELPPDLKKLVITEPDVYRSVGVILPKTRELAPSEAMFYKFLTAFYDRLSRFGD
ncbi:LysR family transcriptional regulator [Camelliibacillus cellulosilyticus]|uniref:LysR family transcriptional regulator n=1 Tax=Camelliibacillus cellulosilyticus TaxID=2174486 RepID=A0ABV9GKC4_9BACL